MIKTVPDLTGLTVQWVREGYAFYKQGVPVDCVKGLQASVGQW